MKPQHLAEHMDDCPHCGVTCALCPEGERLHDADKQLVSDYFAGKNRDARDLKKAQEAGPQ